MSISTTKKP